MPVASGQMPYEYEWPTPFSAKDNQDIGLSGVHLEAAQFVIQAELRKFGVSDSFTTAWRVFTNQSIPAGSGYDPKANGDTLNGLVGPAVVADLDHIAIMRLILMLGLWGSAYDLNEYSTATLLEDWIRQAYPASPSGYKSDQLDGQFLRPVLQEDGQTYIPGTTADAKLGIFTDPDPHWLGGSGIILDIDVGEVMWNPYPVTFFTRTGDSHGRIDNWNITSFPFYPGFQKTDGSIISLNGFENKWPEDPVPTTFGRVGQYEPVGSGFVRFSAYPILQDTDFFFANINDPLSEVYRIEGSPDQMNAVATSARPIGLASRNVQHTDVFLDPIPLGTGLYRVACRNSKVNFPFTTVQSGVVSQWPALPGSFALHITGYEVFNNCFWITDWGDFVGGTGTGPAGPSGFGVVSPFTTRHLWQRNATDDPTQVWDIGDDELKDVRWWYNNANNDIRPYRSLQRVGTNQIVRLIGATEGSVFPAGTSINGAIAIFDDDIGAVTTQNINVSLPTGSFVATLDNMVFDGTDYWIAGSMPGNSKTWRLNSSFVEVERLHGRIVQTLAAYVSDGLGGPQRLVGVQNDDITEYQVIPHVGPEPEANELDAVTTKTLSAPAGMSTIVQIYALIEVTGVPEIKDGVYAYVLARNSLDTVRRLYILRVFEDVTTWEIDQEFLLKTAADDDFLVPSDAITTMGMIVMPVN